MKIWHWCVMGTLYICQGYSNSLNYVFKLHQLFACITRSYNLYYLWTIATSGQILVTSGLPSVHFRSKTHLGNTGGKYKLFWAGLFYLILSAVSLVALLLLPLAVQFVLQTFLGLSLLENHQMENLKGMSFKIFSPLKYLVLGQKLNFSLFDVS